MRKIKTPNRHSIAFNFEPIIMSILAQRCESVKKCCIDIGLSRTHWSRITAHSEPVGYMALAKLKKYIEANRHLLTSSKDIALLEEYDQATS
jgi:hypothetical protein